MSQTVKRLFSKVLRGRARLAHPSSMDTPEPGRSFLFGGSDAEIWLDSKMPKGRVYFVNTEWLKYSGSPHLIRRGWRIGYLGGTPSYFRQARDQTLAILSSLWSALKSKGTTK